MRSAHPGLRPTLIAAAVAALFPTFAAGASVARVDFAVGDVIARGADGQTRPLAKGSEIDAGETVITQHGRAQLRFADGAYMSLQPQTEFTVEQFSYSGKEDGSEGIVMRLARGGMRTITGLIGRSHRENYKLVTAASSIGIRGTEYSVRYTESIEVFCAEGAISLDNQGGSLVLTSGQGAFVHDFQSAPRRTDERPFLPPQSTTAGRPPDVHEKPADPVNPQQDANNCDPTLQSCSVQQQLAQQQVPVQSTPVTSTTVSGPWAVGGEQTWIAGQWTVDASGSVTALANAVEGPVNVGSATAVPAGNDGIVAWGRWVDGVTGGSNPYLSERVLASSGPLHYVVGVPVTNLPASGTATYTMFGQTPASFNGSITSASVTASTISVNFASSVASMTMDLRVNGVDYSTGAFQLNRSTERWGTPNSSGTLLSGGTYIGGCNGTCNTINVSGFLAGDGASRAGMAYNAYMYPVGAVSGPGTVNGVVVYKKN